MSPDDLQLRCSYTQSPRWVERGGSPARGEAAGRAHMEIGLLAAHVSPDTITAAAGLGNVLPGAEIGCYRQEV